MAAGDTDVEADPFECPLVRGQQFERREYQVSLARQALEDHTLVCLPTGLGKTTVSLLVTANRLASVGGRSLMLAPTKPLVEQHAGFYRDGLTVPDEEIVVFTGEVAPEDRAELWADARIVLATPQVIENDLVGSRISLADVTHLTFDECHRATGDYAYNYIAERYHADADRPLVTGMSASPGGDEEAIRRVCANLGLRGVEVRTEADADVAEHTYVTSVDWIHLDLPDEVLAIRDGLNDAVADRLAALVELGVADSTDPEMAQRDLDRIRGKLQELIHNGRSEGYTGMSIHAEVMKLRRAVELVETQSVESLRRYFERQRQAARSSGASKASQRFVSDAAVTEAMRRADDYDDLHPKFRRARMLIAETLGIEEGERVIVFTESRDTAETLTDFLSEHFDTRRFVGQGDKDGSDGMTQREQAATLEAFRAGEFEVLVSTSVAEEGLDVPDVDLVLFYEPVPRGIRSIQRKGRTGRASEGRVVVLIANDTRDEAFFWKAQHEEDRMEAELRALKDVAGDIEATLDQEDITAFGDDEDDEPRSAPDGTSTGTDSGGGEPRNGTQEDGVDGPDAEDVGGTGGQSSGETTAGGDGGGHAGSSADANDGRPDAGESGTAGDGTSGGDGQAGLDSFDDATGEPDQPPAEDGRDGTMAVVDPSVAGEETEIVVDQRELDSIIGRDLSTRDGIRTRLETLSVGDYVLSDRVVVERKTVSDFLDTLLGGDRSLFSQLGDAARHYARPVVVIEGEDLFAERNVHPNAIRGALASIAVDFGVSVLRTDDAAGTADLLATIARREQERADRTVSVHGEKGTKTLPEQQEYVVSAIADVGPVTARALLRHFGSVAAVMTAEEDDLQAVEGVGEVTAERIREVAGSQYDADDPTDGTDDS